jgi:hypothetical protein
VRATRGRGEKDEGHKEAGDHDAVVHKNSTQTREVARRKYSHETNHCSSTAASFFFGWIYCALLWSIIVEKKILGFGSCPRGNW